MKVLVVEDDRDLVELLTFVLKRAGLEVIPAYDAPAALRLLATEEPQLAVLDLNLGQWSGLDVLRDIRQRSQMPVIILTALGSEDDKVLGLELGADDYLTKPFSYRELVARIRAHLRRHGQEPPPPRPPEGTLQVGPLTLNVPEHKAANDRRPLDLTATEFRLLQYLMSNPGRVIPMRTILKEVWGYDDPGGTEVVRVTVHRLRRKLEDNPAEPLLLHTIPGVGVMLKAEEG